MVYKTYNLYQNTSSTKIDKNFRKQNYNCDKQKRKLFINIEYVRPKDKQGV